MVLRIHVKKKDFCFEATNLFSVTGIVDYDKLDNLLARIKYWIQDERHYFSMLDCGGIIAFKITETASKYGFEKLNNIDDTIPQEKIIASVENITGLNLDQIKMKVRYFDVYKPRIVLMSALRFFSKASTNHIGRLTGYDHATVLNACKAVSEFMRSDNI